MLPASAPLASAPLASALPSRAITLIHEYSRPLTRPDWRQSKPIITTYDLYLHVKYIDPRNLFPPTEMLHRVILHNILNTDWYFNYYYNTKYNLTTIIGYNHSFNKN